MYDFIFLTFIRGTQSLKIELLLTSEHIIVAILLLGIVIRSIYLDTAVSIYKGYRCFHSVCYKLHKLGAWEDIYRCFRSKQ